MSCLFCFILQYEDVFETLFFLFSVSTARSSFFDVNMAAVDSPDPLKESKEVVGEGSCPVLSGDTEADTVREPVMSDMHYHAEKAV